MFICYLFRDVYPSVDPGYLYSRIPEDAPREPEKWQNIMEDIEKIIMPGVSWSLIIGIKILLFLFLIFLQS